MKSWLRLKGLIAFVVIVALLITGGLFLAAPITRSVLESMLTSMNGARVDIASVDIQYSPLGMHVQGVQVTDPSQPMQNSVEIGEAKFSVEFSRLLMRKLIIDEMSVSDIRINTPRKTSGAVAQQTEAESETVADTATDGDSFITASLPSVDEVLKNEPLLTDAVSQQVEQKMNEADQRLQAIKQDLGDKTRWDSYEQRYKDIRTAFKGNTKTKLQALKDAKQLSKELKAEQKKISDAKNTIKADLAAVKDGVAQVKQAIGQDKQNLREKYSGSAATGNVVGLLFGSKAAEYTKLTQQWYARIKPYIESEEAPVKVERSKGEYVRFVEYHPQPDFYLQHASISANLPAGKYSGEIKHVSSDQTITRKPAVLHLSGDAQQGRDKEVIYAEFNSVDPASSFTRFKYDLVNYQMRDFVVSGDKSMPVTIKSALMTLKIEGLLKSGNIQANANTDITQAEFQTAASGSSLKGMINDALKNISEFDVRAKAAGQMSSLKFDVSSNIDNKIGAAVNQAIKKQTDDFEKELQAKLQMKYADKLASLEQAGQSLDTIQQQINSKEAELKSKLDNLK